MVFCLPLVCSFCACFGAFLVVFSLFCVVLCVLFVSFSCLSARLLHSYSLCLCCFCPLVSSSLWGAVVVAFVVSLVFPVLSLLARLVSLVSVPLFSRWLLVCRVSSVGGPVVGLGVRWFSAV